MRTWITNKKIRSVLFVCTTILVFVGVCILKPSTTDAASENGCFCPAGQGPVHTSADASPSCTVTNSNPSGRCFASQAEADGTGDPLADPSGVAYQGKSNNAPEIECIKTTGIGPASFPSGFNWAGCAATAGNFILSFVGIYVGAAAIFLNAIIDISIVKFANLITDNTGATGSITVAWTLIRDTLNMAFIFLLLWIGIGTILGLNNVNWQKMIPKIIIAGLLINFSFFFTEALIDISNVTTMQLYGGIQKIGQVATGVTANTTTFTADGLSGALMKGYHLHPPSGAGADQIPLMAFQIFFSIIAFLIVAFVLLVMGVMLLVRMIMLIILLITSPIMVMGGVLPQLSSQSKKWWDTFWDQFTFAPVFMLAMLLVVLISNTTGNAMVTTQVANGGGASGIINDILKFLLPYALSIGLTIGGLVMAKQFAGSAGKGITSWASKKAGSVAFGSAAWASRQTIGRAGRSLQEASWVGRGLKSNNLLYKYSAKAAALTGQRATQASFDVRAGSIGGFIPGAGKGRTGGLESDIKARAKRRAENAKVYDRSIAIQNLREEAAAKQKALERARTELQGAQSIGGLPGQIEERVKEKQEAVDKAERDLAKSRNALKELQGGFGASDARKEYEEAMRNLTAAQIEEAKGVASVIEAQERRVKSLKDASDYDRDNAQKRAAYQAEQQKLDEFKRRQLEKDHGAALMAYVDAQKVLADAQKTAGDARDAARQAYGMHMAGSRFESTRQAADELRKRSKKSDQAILDELKKVMETVEQAPTIGTTPPATGATGSGGSTPIPPGGVPTPGPTGEPERPRGGREL